MKKYLIVILLAVIIFQLQAANILELFQNMPNQLAPTLNSGLKTELINNYIGGKDSIENQYSGIAKVTLLDTDDNILQLQSSAIGQIELKLFYPSDNDTIIGYINSVCTPTCYSEILFFDTHWQAIYVERIDYRSFFTTKNDTTIRLFESWGVSQLIKYSFSTNSTIKASFATFNYLDNEQQEKIRGIIKNNIKLVLKPCTSGYSLTKF